MTYLQATSAMSERQACAVIGADRSSARYRSSKPQQNGFVESFDGRMRDEVLNETLFRSLAHARAVLVAWRRD